MSARRRRLARQNKGRPLGSALQVLFVLLVMVFVLSLGGVALGFTMVTSWLDGLPDPDEPGAFEVAQTTRIYSADGKLLARLYLENRTVVPISKISTDLVDAVVAIEDERYYTHQGVDPVGLARAVVVNLTQGFGEEGASTITQQYVRNTLLLDERTDITIARKIREAYLATELEKRYDKTEILEMYLNAIYFGEGAYGAEAAARTYFSKSAAKLSLAESALLAGLPQQPTRLNPMENAEAAIGRRNQVLNRMLDNGYITQEEFEEARDTPLKLKPAKLPEGGIYTAPYFVAHVKKLLQDQYSSTLVFKGGLRVYTTLDTRTQKQAEKAVKDGLPSSGPEAALVAIDPRDGQVKALVGGRDYDENKFNLATQGKRQAGSAFKTFALVAALKEGMSPYYRINSSSPASIPTKPKPWLVSNSEGRGRGMMTLERATQMSVNTVFARVAWEIGAKKIAKTAKKMGIETTLRAYPSISLGAQNVTPLEMASAYGTLANNGRHVEPVFITKVEDSSREVIFESETSSAKAVEPEIAAETNRILRGVISSGTARRANIGRPAAGKTGTSQKHRDVWFVGYTPQLVTAVWVGHPKEQTIYVRGARAFGGTVAAPIWAQFMKTALAGEPVLSFKKADKPKYDYARFKVVSTPASRTAPPKPAEPSKKPAAEEAKPPAEEPKEPEAPEKPPGTPPDPGDTDD